MRHFYHSNKMVILVALFLTALGLVWNYNDSTFILKYYILSSLVALIATYIGMKIHQNVNAWFDQEDYS